MRSNKYFDIFEVDQFDKDKIDIKQPINIAVNA